MKQISKILENPRFIYVGIGVLTFIGLSLRFLHRMHIELDGDEIYTINILTRHDSFLQFVSKLPYLEFSSYLSGDYYILYPFVQIFGANKWGVALPHMVSTGLCFYFLFKVCQLHVKNAVGFFIAFAIVCFNNNLIAHSFEIRYYAIMQTLGLAVYYYTYRLIYQPQSLTKSKRVALGTFFVLAILFHLYSVILVGTVILFFLAIQIHTKSAVNTFKKIAPLFLTVFLITGPILYFVLFVQPHVSPEIWSNEPFKFIPNPLDSFVGFLKGILGNLVGCRIFYVLLLGLPLALGLPQQERRNQFWFFFLLICLPICLLLLLDLKTGYWFIQRQFIWVMPLFAVLLGWCWESVLHFASAYLSNPTKASLQKVS